MRKDNDKFIPGMTISIDGITMYYFNASKISLSELLDIENQAFMNAKVNSHRLFKLYDTDSLGYTVCGLN